MRNSKTQKATISIVVLSVSAVLWILLLFNPGNIMTVDHCHVSLSGPSETSLQMLLEMNPLSGMLIGWTLMVFAMMLPKLIFPIQFIYERTFKQRRFLSAVLFVLGYALTWILVGFVMNAIILASNFLMPQSFTPALLVGIIAVIWQFSPIKQRFLNRGHEHRSLAAFGWAANRDALLFGLIHGVWCVCAGWGLMLFPMLLPQGHNIAMLIVTFIMTSEHMDHPQIPRWQFDLRLKLLRILLAQTTIRLKQQALW
ncbi:MAG: hypothetical protein D3903_12985 [Candidatus Electrothrix sp. GM3_4]|nr:hypothetical protein [Candidatus Electrothrix sp. GM3_4]